MDSERQDSKNRILAASEALSRMNLFVAQEEIEDAATPLCGPFATIGTGKAGIAAQKMAATMRSYGMDCRTLNVPDVLHGDMGGLPAKGFTLYAFSHSGETPELIHSLRGLHKAFPAMVIVAITAGDKDCALLSISNKAVVYNLEEEYCPFGLAPTTSFLQMVLVGDLIACELAQYVSSVEMYSRYHPAGMLGTMTLRVGDIMRTGDRVATCTDAETRKEIERRIYAAGCGAIAVASHGKLLGIITDGDLRRSSGTFAYEIVHPFPKTCHPDDTVSSAMRTMKEHKIDELLVVDSKNNLVGLLDIQDVMAHVHGEED